MFIFILIIIAAVIYCFRKYCSRKRINAIKVNIVQSVSFKKYTRSSFHLSLSSAGTYITEFMINENVNKLIFPFNEKMYHFDINDLDVKELLDGKMISKRIGFLSFILAIRLITPLAHRNI